MTAEEYLQMQIGQLHFQVAQLSAELEKARAEIAQSRGRDAEKQRDLPDTCEDPAAPAR